LTSLILNLLSYFALNQSHHAKLSGHETAGPENSLSPALPFLEGTDALEERSGPLNPKWRMSAMDMTLPDSPDVIEHFTARAGQYDESSHWCTDPEMMERLRELAAPHPVTRMLDVACGTGLVTRAFRDRAASVVGVDLTPAMATRSLQWLDLLLLGSAESLPFSDQAFDLTICRQGIQFMEAALAAREMVRVTRAGGRVVLVNLCAYGEEDKEEYFEILRLRNPARRVFFMPEDLGRLLSDAGCREVEVHYHISSEDIAAWSENGAITNGRCEQIQTLYRHASPAFKELHKVQYLDDGRIVDHMLFAIAVGIP
jgi:SAM-dependent methyltransferase